jgi:hypothetical protein
MAGFGDCSDRKIPELCPGLPANRSNSSPQWMRLDQIRGMDIAEQLDPGEGGVQILDHLSR